MELSGQLHASAALPPDTYWIGGLVGPRFSLDAVEKWKRKFRSPGNRTRTAPARSPSLSRLKRMWGHCYRKLWRLVWLLRCTELDCGGVVCWCRMKGEWGLAWCRTRSNITVLDMLVAIVGSIRPAERDVELREPREKRMEMWYSGREAIKIKVWVGEDCMIYKILVGRPPNKKETTEIRWRW
jgi:hypothetical protein